MDEDKSWCVIKIIEPNPMKWSDRTEKFYAMRMEDTSPFDRMNENLSKEEAEAIMHLLRITQGESK